MIADLNAFCDDFNTGTISELVLFIIFSLPNSWDFLWCYCCVRTFRLDILNITSWVSGSYQNLLQCCSFCVCCQVSLIRGRPQVQTRFLWAVVPTWVQFHSLHSVIWIHLTLARPWVQSLTLAVVHTMIRCSKPFHTCPAQGWVWNILLSYMGSFSQPPFYPLYSLLPGASLPAPLAV